MKRALLIVMMLLSVIGALLVITWPDRTPPSWYDIQLGTQDDVTSSHLKLTVAPLTPNEFATSQARVEAELRRYPQGLLGRSRVVFYLVGELDGKGLGPAGGAVSQGDVWIAMHEAGENTLVSDYDLGIVLHHEVATLVAVRYVSAFARDEWQNLLPEGVKYRPVRSMSSGKAREVTDSDRRRLEKGFVTEYAQNSISDDWSEVASLLMCDPTTLNDYSARYERIDAKRRTITELYTRLGVQLKRVD